MRATFPTKLEKARVTHGKMASGLDEPFGFFLVKKADVKLKIMIGDGMGWDHVSVSVGWSPRPRENGRIPTGDEMCWVKSLVFEPGECVVQYHPPEKDYVNFHPMVLHMWRPQKGEFPMPPRMCV